MAKDKVASSRSRTSCHRAKSSWVSILRTRKSDRARETSRRRMGTSAWVRSQKNVMWPRCPMGTYTVGRMGFTHDFHGVRRDLYFPDVHGPAHRMLTVEVSAAKASL